MTIATLTPPVLFERWNGETYLYGNGAASQIVPLFSRIPDSLGNRDAFTDWLANRTFWRVSRRMALDPFAPEGSDGAEVAPHADAYDAAIRYPSVLSRLLLNESVG